MLYLCFTTFIVFVGCYSAISLFYYIHTLPHISIQSALITLYVLFTPDSIITASIASKAVFLLYSRMGFFHCFNVPDTQELFTDAKELCLSNSELSSHLLVQTALTFFSQQISCFACHKAEWTISKYIPPLLHINKSEAFIIAQYHCYIGQ